jgi:hypothetical protein
MGVALVLHGNRIGAEYDLVRWWDSVMASDVLTDEDVDSLVSFMSGSLQRGYLDEFIQEHTPFDSMQELKQAACGWHRGRDAGSSMGCTFCPMNHITPDDAGCGGGGDQPGKVS